MSAKSHGLPPLVYVFGDESGSFHSGDFLVIGLLLCQDPAARRAELAALRAEYSFYRELKYSDRDKFRLPFALAVIRWFVATPDLYFRCIAKPADQFDLGYYRSGWRGLPPETLAYNYTYAEVIGHNLPSDPHRLIVKVDERTRNVGDNMLAYLKQKVPTIRTVEEAASDTDDLLQVIDLLIGCVHGKLVGEPGVIQQALIDTFLHECGMKTLRSPSPLKERVNIWQWRGKKRAAGSS